MNFLMLDLRILDSIWLDSILYFIRLNIYPLLLICDGRISKVVVVSLGSALVMDLWSNLVFWWCLASSLVFTKCTKHFLFSRVTCTISLSYLISSTFWLLLPWMLLVVLCLLPLSFQSWNCTSFTITMFNDVNSKLLILASVDMFWLKHNRQIQPKRLVHYVGVSWRNLASYSTQCGTHNMILDIVFLDLLIVSLVINEIPLKLKKLYPIVTVSLAFNWILMRLFVSWLVFI